jgi:hypothetical protein
MQIQCNKNKFRKEAASKLPHREDLLKPLDAIYIGIIKEFPKQSKKSCLKASSEGLKC